MATILGPESDHMQKTQALNESDNNAVLLYDETHPETESFAKPKSPQELVGHQSSSSCNAPRPHIFNDVYFERLTFITTSIVRQSQTCLTCFRHYL